MRTRFPLLATTALALSLVTPALAHADERRCLDEMCFYQSLPTVDALLSGAGADGTEPGGVNSTVARTFGTWGVDLKGMDTSVNPGDDFFRYVNGKAVDAIVIPDDRTSWGAFAELRNLSDNRLKVIIDDLSTKQGLTGDEKKIADFYNSMMDTKARNALDVAPLAPTLANIRNIKTKGEMAAYMGQTSGKFGASIFGPSINADQKNPGINILYVSQSGLSLPDRDYYLKDSFAAKKTLYEAYVTDVLRMVGYPNAAQAAKDIVAFETKIAEASWSRIENRDDNKTYNPMTIKEIAASSPGFDFVTFFKASGLDKAEKIVVSQNTAFPKIAKIYADTPLETIKAWQTFKTVDEAAPYLSDRFSTRQWEFRSRDLSGAKVQRPLWKRALSVTDGAMGEALGREYVNRYFPAESKTMMQGLVADLKTAMGKRIDGLTWMSAETKAKAHEKLNKFGVKIAYPDKWKDYSKLEVKADDLYGNIVRNSQFRWNERLAKLNKPVDPLEWGMTPQTVNAYYSPTRNEIVFPAAILQPPFFDPKADPAVNYGAIGGVIGHEITHGFDDQGRKSDGDGVLRDWWTAEDGAKFDAQAKIFGAQYDTYEPLPGAHVQGGLTMGENIADLGGVLMGLEAYRLSLKGAEAPVLDGITGDQRVFLGFAQVWATKYRDDALRAQVVSDPHSPGMFRVIGPMRNIDDWYKAFNVKDGKYYLKPEDRVRIW
ncbi:peptidase M13 [Asticcacaulis sp. BYS171W]|uniref:Peptidase M13 n=1 Tax=Asticcacaulis aquaticus TaxID=2984212 RepID=A0ABT5HW01_9CAUL|nr:M13-type metalloendopeptidase [Asticcacaulis aquaticus]MDC7683616.1 peptidase M13 [Asticcacaulis aquaticus]